MPAALPDIMARLSAALTQIGSPEAERAPDVSVEKPTRAQIGKSIQGDGMVSFPDGKSHTSLKSHLASRGLDPRSYRDHSGLPADYRVVVPWHAGQRSALARAVGPGRAGPASRTRSRDGRNAARRARRSHRVTIGAGCTMSGWTLARMSC